MKNIVQKCAIATAMLSLGSCNNMLDMPSRNSYESNVVFSSLQRTEMVIRGIYPNFKNKAMIAYITGDNDETYSTLSGNERAGLSKYNFAAGSGQMKPVLESRYLAINNANECIVGLEENNVLDEQTASGKKFLALYGEALTLRALAYFDLIRFYGDVPFPLTPTRAGMNFNLPRTNRDLIYDKIIKDLQYASTIVPWQSEVTHHDRITKGAVYGLLSRIALHAAGYSLRWNLETYDAGSMQLARRNDTAKIRELYQIARDACYEIMLKESTEHQLELAYVDSFMAVHSKKYSKENIFELGNYGLSANDEIGYSMGLAIAAGTPQGYMPSGPLVRVTPTLYLSFDPSDARRDVTCGNFSIVKTTGMSELVNSQNLACGKWRRNWQSNQGPENGKTDLNWVLLRYADILLMFAEADNYLTPQPSDEAIEAFKKVRRRAFDISLHAEKVDGYVAALTTKELFLDAIIDERKWELACESNIRRTDLIRWNRLGAAINDTRAKLQSMYDNGMDGQTAKSETINPYTGATIPRYRIYKKIQYAANKELTAVPYTESTTSTVTTDQIAYDFLAISSYGGTSGYIVKFAQYFYEKQCELMPLNQSLIDTNSALRGQQHPGFK